MEKALYSVVYCLQLSFIVRYSILSSLSGQITMMRVGTPRPSFRLMLIPLVLWGGQVHALGLGAITLQSGLGRPLAARIPVYGLGPDDAGASCIKSRMMALEGGLLARPVAEITGSGAATMLTLRTAESINEPAFNVSVEIGCTSSVKREYQILLDPVPAARKSVV